MKRIVFVYFFAVFIVFNTGGLAIAAIEATGRLTLERPLFYAPVIKKNVQPDRSSKTSNNCQRHKEIADLLKKYNHAIKRYIRSKTRSILEKKTFRIKTGMTLSQYFQDYKKYRVFLRTQKRQEIEVKNQKIKKNYYIWKEGDKIIMGSDVMLMSDQAKNQLIDRVTKTARRKWAADEYHRVAEKTRKAASSTAFRLDCQHSDDLDRLVKKATNDLMAQEDDRVISPRTFDRLLTILRAYITFNYYKDLSHDEFDERFKKLGRKIGRGYWTHQKLTRLLGLHVMGRIESNRAFRKTYAKAIARAAEQNPAIPRKWIEEIIWIETRGDPMTISRAGAYGLMQLMPLVYIGIGRDKAQQIPLAFERTINPFNPDTNIERGAEFLDKLQRLLKPYMRGYGLATRKKIIFHAYNGGVSRVISLLKKYGLGYKRFLPGETKDYLNKLVDFPGR
jgi:hypothetical protein